MAVGFPRLVQQGFSILELLLVLVILALGYQLASPVIGNMGSGDLKSSARTIAVAPPQQKFPARFAPRAEATEAFHTARKAVENPPRFWTNQR